MTRGWKITFLSALGLALISCAYYLRAIFLPVLVALLLAYVLNPALNALERRKVPRLASIAGIYALMAGALVLIFALAVPAVFGEASEFLKTAFTGENPKIYKLIARVQPALERTLGMDSAKAVTQMAHARVEELKKELPTLGPKILGDVAAFAFGGLASLLSVVAFLALIPVYLFFLLKNLNTWWESFTHWIPPAYRVRTLSTLGRIHRANLAFFRGQILISFLEGTIVFVGLRFIGVPYSLLFGGLYAVLSVIPYLGVVTMFAVVEGAVLADSGQFGSQFWLVAGVFGVIQILEGAVFQPLILGKETGLHPILIILALLVAGQLLGLFGMLIAIPLASSVKILLEDYVLPMFEDVADLTRVRRRSEAGGLPPPSP
jgi:predicted PurR-regulated permease PerM